MLKIVINRRQFHDFEHIQTSFLSISATDYRFYDRQLFIRRKSVDLYFAN